MTDRPTILLTSQETRQRAARWAAEAPPGTIVEFRKPRRTLEQNARLWALLTDVARQVEWGGKKRTTEAWKDIFTAALRSSHHELDIVPGIEGGFVLLGMHTSSMDRGELAELMDLIEAFGAQHGVIFNEPSAAAKGPAGANNPAGAGAALELANQGDAG